MHTGRARTLARRSSPDAVRLTASAIARMCSGDVPQQPPMMRAPSATASARKQREIFRRRARIHHAVAHALGKSGVGHSRKRHAQPWPVLPESAAAIADPECNSCRSPARFLRQQRRGSPAACLQAWCLLRKTSAAPRSAAPKTNGSLRSPPAACPASKMSPE